MPWSLPSIGLVGFIAISVQAITPAFAHGQASGMPPGLGDVVAVALRNNPDIVAARLRADSAHGEQRIARALPSLGLAVIPAVPFQYSVGAPLDIGPQRVFRTRVDGYGLRAAQSDVEDASRQVVFAVRQAFYDVLLAQVQRDIAAQRRDIFHRLFVADSARLLAGDLPQRELTRSEIEWARSESELTRAGAAVRAARLALQLLMGNEHPDTAFALTGELVYRPVEIPTDSLLALGTANRPDIRAARERMAQSHASVHLATAALIPVPTVSLVYQRDPPFGSGSSYAVGIGLSLPLFNWYGGDRERARAGLEAATSAERRARAQLANDVQTALDGYRTARGLAEQYDGGLRTKAQATLETARYAYQTGAISLLELLDAVRTYTDTESDYYMAVHDYWVSVFALSRATGKDFVP